MLEPDVKDRQKGINASNETIYKDRDAFIISEPNATHKLFPFLKNHEFSCFYYLFLFLGLTRKKN